LNYWHFINLTALVVCVVLNYIAVALPVGKYTVKEISQKYYTLVTPAGYAFSIWSIIYFLLLLYTALAVLNAIAGREKNRDADRVAPIFFLSCVLNPIWLFAAHNGFFGISLIIMILLYASVAYIYFMLRINYHHRLTAETFIIKAPFSVYLGWLSVAAVANAAVYLVSTRAKPLVYHPLFMMVALLFAAILALVFAVLKNDYFFAAAVAWGLLGIYVNQVGMQLIMPERKKLLVVASQVSLKIFLVAAAAVIFSVLRGIYRQLKNGESSANRH